jgi:hypothetical protein
MPEAQSGRILIEPHFLPTLEFFCLIMPYDVIVLDVHSHYMKQSYRNRALINTSNGAQTLVVPVTNKSNRTPLHEVMTSETENWRISGWRSIESAYRNSPYFEFYADDLKKILLGDEKNLVNLNRSILTVCLNWLAMEKKVECTTGFVETFSGEDKRNVLNAKSSFETRNIMVPVPYKQVFGSVFLKNLSVLDLICCCGPQSTGILHRSMK